ncbi:MAG: DUF4340 domain-containing protein [Lachnospiraceae bacterium]
MNRSKKLYVLLGILVLACVVTFAVCKYEEKKEQIKNSDEVILEIATEDVNALSWEYESETLSFHKDDKWVYDDDEAFPVSEEKMDDLLEMFQEFGVSFIIEDVEDYGQYGLDDPICTIHIETEDETYEIQLGDYSTMDSERYVSIGDGNVYLVENDPLESYDAELSEVIDNDDLPDFANAKVNKLKVEGDDDVYFTEQDGTKCPLDTSRVDSYLETITNLNLTDYVTYNVTEDELAAYGLAHPEITVTVEYTPEDDEETEEAEDAEEKTFAISVARDPEEVKEAEEDTSKEDEEGEEITAYARAGESKIIYKITGDQYEALMKGTYNDLRHQEVLSADFADIQKIDISLEGEDYTITAKEKDDETIWYYEDEEIEIEDFQSALESLEAQRFTNKEPDGKEEISLTVYLDNENYPEVTIELYRYDGSDCMAVVDGEPVSLVARDTVIDLIEAVNAIVLN